MVVLGILFLGRDRKKSGRKLQENEFFEEKVTGLFTADRFQSGKIMVFEKI